LDHIGAGTADVVEDCDLGCNSYSYKEMSKDCIDNKGEVVDKDKVEEEALAAPNDFLRTLDVHNFDYFVFFAA